MLLTKEHILTLIKIHTVAIIYGFCSIGWLKNLVKIYYSDFAVITGMLALRIVGVALSPLGAVLGYM